MDAHPDRTFRARITQCRNGAKTVGGVVTYETVLEVGNSNHLLRPGMTATAQIAAKEIKNAVLVPNAALQFVPPIQENKRRSGGLADMLLPAPPSQSAAGESNTGSAGGARQVWVLKDGEPVAVPVTVGATDGARTEILAPDIAPGTRVVVGLLDTAR